MRAAVPPGIDTNAHDFRVLPSRCIGNLIKDLVSPSLGSFSRMNLFLRRKNVVKGKERVVRLRIRVNDLPDASRPEGSIIGRAIDFAIEEPGRELRYIFHFERVFAPEDHLAAVVA